MDRDATGAGVPLTEYADGVGITGRPKQYVLTMLHSFAQWLTYLLLIALQ